MVEDNDKRQSLAAPKSASSHSLVLRSGYSVEIAEGDNGEIVSVKTPSGQIGLRIKLTPEGPVAELSSVSLQISAQKDLTLNCQTLALNAEKQVAIKSGGDLVQIAKGDLQIKAEGEITSEGFSQQLRANTGDFSIAANDDVMVDGERIRLNSPRTPSELRETRALIERLAAPNKPDQ